jgi:hypothetical protein
VELAKLLNIPRMTRNHPNGTVVVDYRQRKDFAGELRVFLLTDNSEMVWGWNKRTGF